MVWYKRDLRLDDHLALARAASAGRVLPLHVVEPAYWQLPDTSFRHWEFLRGCVSDLAAHIDRLGGALRVHEGRVIDALEEIRDVYGPFRLFAHEETGNAWTFDRDRSVRDWCRRNHIPFTEEMQFGVWRGSSANRDKWASRWDAMMAEPTLDIPPVEWVPTDSHALPTARALGLADDGIARMQTPGRAAALNRLNRFLYESGETYQKDMSTPISGEDGCSRMSPYLASGSLSIREVYQATLRRQAEIAALPSQERGMWASSLRSFAGRLHWHCHFTQKLETEPAIEQRPMARVYEGLRSRAADPALLTAFETGQTGYPFVDACMRYLRATGWINFRMRAMLMSFASYNLWLPWQESGLVLARLFTDYEPGIHWPQSQMQAGETGINTVRIYSPVKQGRDQDPTGVFTRTWVPEIAHLSDAELQEPWLAALPPSGYPRPVVDYRETTDRAKSAIYGLRKTDAARTEASDVARKHGSRKPRRPHSRHVAGGASRGAF